MCVYIIYTYICVYIQCDIYHIYIMEYIYIYISHTFFIHSSVNGHLGFFHVFVVVNSAAMKFQAHLGVSFLETDLFLFI